MTARERSKWYSLTILRALLAFLDLAGILAIGFIVTSTAIFLTSGSEPGRVLQFAGLSIPAVTAQTLPWVSSAVLLLFLSKALFSVLLTKKAAFFVANVEARSAKTIVETSFGGDLGQAQRHSREEVMFAIQVGSPSAFNTLLNAANALFTEAVLFFLICAGFFFVDPWATLAAVIYFGLIASVMQYFVGSLMTKSGQLSAVGSLQANTAISDLMSVFRELLVLGKRKKYIEAIYRARVTAANSIATQHYLTGMPRYIVEAALLVGVALFVLSQALAGDIVKSAATIGVFLSGGFRLTAALLPLQNSLLTINAALAAAGSAHAMLANSKVMSVSIAPPKTNSLLQADDNEELRATYPIGVRFNNVYFSYPDAIRAALKKVSFEIKPGTQVALMGPSGAGKSTVADLLCSVLTPSLGSITLTNQIEGPTGRQVEARVSYVPQRPGLVSGTILDNVALAEDPDKADRQQAFEALRMANLSDVIKHLPHGLDAPLGKLRDSLSGGQIQRLGLARALYSNPGLLIMDEATSALDAESEAEIQKALEGLRGKVTVVLIAHRVNTIQNADTVFLLEEGRLVDQGTFQELLKRNPSVERVVELMRVRTD